MHRLRILLLSFFLLSALLMDTPSQAAPSQSEDETLLILREPGGVMFISAESVTALLEDPLDPRLELSQEEKNGVRESYEMAVKSEQDYRNLDQLTGAGCLLPPLHWDISGHDPGSKSLQELVDIGHTVVTGTVKRVTPGLIRALPGKPVSAVFVEINEVKKEEPSHEPLIEEIFYFQFSANARFGEKRLCTENVGFYEAQVGDEVLVLGNTYRGIPGFFRPRQVFEILENERIQPEPYIYLKSGSLPTLEDLEF